MGFLKNKMCITNNINFEFGIRLIIYVSFLENTQGNYDGNF